MTAFPLHLWICFSQVLDGFQPFAAAHGQIIFIVKALGFSERLGFMNPYFFAHGESLTSQA
jgi:hypothetical protein